MHLPLGRAPHRETPSDTRQLYERPRERIFPVLFRLLATLIVAATITGAIGIFRYQPLTSRGTPPAGVTVAAPGAGTTYTVAYEPGASFEYSFVIRNDGRWGITVTGLAPPAHPTFDPVLITQIIPGSSEPAPMEAFGLAPGHEATLNVRITFAPCATPPPPASRSTWDDEIVSFRVAGVTRDQSVPLPYRILIEDAAARSC